MLNDNLHVLQHPLLKDLLTKMRDKNTAPALFRSYLENISRFMVYESTRDLELQKISINTPLERIPDAPCLKSELVLASIMRAGNGMLDSALKCYPSAAVAHLGMYRGKDLKSVEYYMKIPKHLETKTVLLLDPMLATGNSAVTALQKLLENGAKDIRFLCILAVKEGIQNIQKHFPETNIFCLAVDRELNERSYILPGIGDAGDRIYATVHD